MWDFLRILALMDPKHHITMKRLEVCAGSIESIHAAHQGGAYRVELCSALSEDGLTPSAAMIQYARSLPGLKVHVLIRPRAGNFVYTQPEIQCMEQDIRLCRQWGVDGVVIGALTPQGTIDVPACQRLVQAAQGMSITFHRAFDVCQNPSESLEQIIALGCHRLLTSGQAATAQQGIAVLRQLVQQAAGRLCIMPGSGVNPANAAEILQLTGATEIHASARSSRVFGWLETDEEIVRQLVQRINS